MIRKPLDPDAAQAVAIQALTYLGEDDERLGRFVEATGLHLDTLRSAATSPDFLAGVLDYLVSDESLLIAFAARLRIKPEAVMAAKYVLSPVME